MKQLQGNLMTRTRLPRTAWDISATRFRRWTFRRSPIRRWSFRRWISW